MRFSMASRQCDAAGTYQTRCSERHGTLRAWKNNLFQDMLRLHADGLAGIYLPVSPSFSMLIVGTVFGGHNAFLNAAVRKS
jgi:hypothetical protein